ncbi:MAG TPA: GNAT family N-acetyltransferase [Candidatus Limnocylindrales bacterium]|nr:GNAT family N-acetyltransferase [Candidatus Limnocylindrales bacterium]
MHIFGVEPGLFGAAFAAGGIVGVVSPELKTAVVRPSHRRRGVGRRLIDLALSMEASRHRPELFMGSVPDDPGGAAFLEATGFTFHSTVWNLDLPPDRAVPDAVWPDGVVARRFDRDLDVAALPAAVNEAFVGHPTPIVMEEEMVRASLDDPNILDDDAIILEDGQTGEIVGFCLADIRRADGRITSDHGEISMIGVRRDRRGQGLGRQLLRAGSTYLRRAGTPNVGLAVNARNEGALGLYESEGFIRVRTRDRWVRPVATPPA